MGDYDQAGANFFVYSLQGAMYLIGSSCHHGPIGLAAIVKKSPRTHVIPESFYLNIPRERPTQRHAGAVSDPAHAVMTLRPAQSRHLYISVLAPSRPPTVPRFDGEGYEYDQWCVRNNFSNREIDFYDWLVVRDMGREGKAYQSSISPQCLSRPLRHNQRLTLLCEEEIVARKSGRMA